MFTSPPSFAFAPTLALTIHRMSNHRRIIPLIALPLAQHPRLLHFPHVNHRHTQTPVPRFLQSASNILILYSTLLFTTANSPPPPLFVLTSANPIAPLRCCKHPHLLPNTPLCPFGSPALLHLVLHVRTHRPPPSRSPTHPDNSHLPQSPLHSPTHLHHPNLLQIFVV